MDRPQPVRTIRLCPRLEEDQMTRIARRALIVGAAMILAGCGSSGMSVSSPSAAASPSISASAAPSASPVASPSPSPTVEPSPSRPPAVHISLPAGWQEVEMAAGRLTAQIEAIEPSNPLIAAAMRQSMTSG